MPPLAREDAARGSLSLSIRVHPKSASARYLWDGTVLELWLREPAIDGAANAAVIREVAALLRVPRSAVRIVAGHRSRSKRAVIAGRAQLPPPSTLA
jgi:uncharacterized protein YggU (UPF0235/DUF167 family)